MKEISSLPKGCALNANITVHEHTALKLDNPALILCKKYNLRKLAYYISFGKYVISKATSLGVITYYNEFGHDLFSEYYRLEDESYVLHTRFVQLIERVIQVE